MKIILILAVVAVLTAVVIGAVRAQKSPANAAEVTAGLRQQALTSPAKDLGIPLSAHQPFLVLMDMGYSKAVVSVVATEAGDASIYFSTGGGIIGGGGHEGVRKAASQFVAESAKYISAFKASNDFSSPAAGDVRFVVRTPEAVLVSPDVVETELGNGKHALSPLFYAAQHVIAQLRQHAQAP